MIAKDENGESGFGEEIDISKFLFNQYRVTRNTNINGYIAWKAKKSQSELDFVSIEFTFSNKVVYRTIAKLKDLKRVESVRRF